MITIQTKNYTDDELEMVLSLFLRACSEVDRSNMRTLHDDLYRTTDYLMEAIVDRDRAKYGSNFTNDI